ncbi:hypothetical protein HYQ44_015041 [Verticillium longisporum]|nr:hypothetical protein HYQ44_015041 [Verticillium longisporum]
MPLCSHKFSKFVHWQHPEGLVVGALEGRGGEGGGPDGEVEFEKVGWGRWDARRRGHPARRTSPPTDNDYVSGIPINKSSAGGRGVDRSRLHATSSETAGSMVFSHDDHDPMMMEDEADKMSLDGSASASCSEAPDDDMIMNDDPEDVTDDEDWAAEMQALNKRFGKMHGISSLLNLGTFIATIAYGFTLGSRLT